MEQAAGQARGSSTSLPAQLSFCIFSGCCNLCKAAKLMISCSCGSGDFNALSVFIEPHSIPATTAKARVVQLCPWVPASSSLSLHLPRVWMLDPSRAQHGASEACLLMSLLRLSIYFISLSVKTHHQPAYDLSVPETTRVWAEFFLFSFLACTKKCQRHNLLQWNREHTNQNWHLLTSNSFVPRRQEIKRQLIWANKPIFYVFLQSFSL